MLSERRKGQTQQSGISRGLLPTVLLLCGILAASQGRAIDLAQKPLFLAVDGKPPNVLLIPDTSESMQENPEGRLALDRGNPECDLGPDLDPETCPAGARSPESKASIVKRVARTIVQNFQESANLGLMSYQQEPASLRRDDFNSGGTVRWRLVQRAVDARYSTEDPGDGGPDWYDPSFEGPWDADTKRFVDPHPVEEGVWIYYNVAIPGYDWNTGQDGTTGVPDHDRDMYLHWSGSMSYGGDAAEMTGYDRLTQAPGGTRVEPDSGLHYHDRIGTLHVFLVDSLRQRGIGHWGERLAFMPANQLEWRTTTAPGPGYLHVPLGGLDDEGEVDEAHRERIEAKLQPQRLDWDPAQTQDPMTDPDWPLIAAGLTPLEGTMLTARDYFLGGTEYFGEEQGNIGDTEIPRTCEDDNDVIWVTDGLPSVDADGNALGDDPEEAVERAVEAVRELHDSTAERFERGVRTHIVGFAMPEGMEDVVDDPLDRLADAGGTGAAHDAEDEEALQQVMDRIMEEIIADARGTAASVATSSTRITEDTVLYQSRFNSSAWTGDLEALHTDSETGRVTGQKWSAAGKLDAWSNDDIVDERNVLTCCDGTGRGPGIRLRDEQPEFSRLSDALLLPGEEDEVAAERIRYLLGDHSGEERHLDDDDEDGFRDRTSRLGDIVNSEPVYTHGESFGHRNLRGIPDSYVTFVQEKRDRQPMVYVGANDGMLHGFDADSGENVFSYMPALVLDEVHELTDPDYRHRYYVDGSPAIGDAWLDGQWRTVLVGTLGAGGSGVFALDVSEPGDFSEEHVLWEFDHPELGEGVEEASIVRMADGEDGYRWVAVFGNGYNSESRDSRLMVVDLETGELVDEIRAGGGSALEPNGMATPLVIDSRGDRNADRIYAGDLRGNLWKFETDGEGGWQLADLDGGEDGLLFTAEADGQRQPITARPQAGLTEDEEWLVLIGSGRYLELADTRAGEAGDGVDSLYGIIDRGQAIGAREHALLEQEIVEQDDAARMVSDEEPDDDHRGWYLDLDAEPGERVVEQALLISGVALFTTLVPLDHPCEAGGESWLMSMDATTGARLESGFFLEDDVEGEPEPEDFINLGDLPASGVAAGVGVASRPTFMQGEDGATLRIAGSAGDRDLPPDPPDPSGGGTRQSWRQLR